MAVLNDAFDVKLAGSSIDAVYLGGERVWSPWTPARLFTNGEQGVWYELKPEYLYQDAAGTTPVTADGDPVGRMLDLSGNGNHATQSTSAARPTYRTDGTLHWLEFDGVDDWLLADSVALAGSDKITIATALRSEYTGVGTRILLEAGAIWSQKGGAFVLHAPRDAPTEAAYQFGFRGTVERLLDAPYNDYAPSRTDVLVSSADIGAANAALWVNGTLVTQSTDSLGSGAFGDHPLSIGARNGDNAFLGRFYGATLVNDYSASVPRGRLENYLATLAGVQL